MAPDNGEGFRERLVRWSPPEPFPTDLLAAQCIPTDPDQAVDLEYRDGELSGSACGQAVSVVLPTLKWERRATLAGSIGGQSVQVDWQMVHVGARDGSDGYAAGLAGLVEPGEVAIEAVLHFAPSGWPMARALVAGELSGLGLEARVTPDVSAPADGDAYLVSGGLYVGSERVAAKHARFVAPPPFPFAFYVTTNRTSRGCIRGHTSTGAVCIDCALRFAEGRHVKCSGAFRRTNHVATASARDDRAVGPLEGWCDMSRSDQQSFQPVEAEDGVVGVITLSTLHIAIDPAAASAVARRIQRSAHHSAEPNRILGSHQSTRSVT